MGKTQSTSQILHKIEILNMQADQIRECIHVGKFFVGVRRTSVTIFELWCKVKSQLQLWIPSGISLKLSCDSVPLASFMDLYVAHRRSEKAPYHCEVCIYTLEYIDTNDSRVGLSGLFT